MRRIVYKKYLEHLNTTKFLVFISITVLNLFILLVVMFYIIVGNSDLHEDLPCEGSLSYVVYNKPQVEDFSEWNNNCDWMLIIVNSKNKISPMYSKELLTFAGVDFDSRIVADLKDMILDAREKADVKLFVSSGYRSIERQEERFNKMLEENIKNGLSEDEARKLTESQIASPGFSEHNLGLAVDFNGAKDDFASTPEYNWLLENAYKYGFILRYPEDKQNITKMSYKPWHFRYVGEQNAKIMKEKNFCLEEYVSSIINSD